MQACRSQLQRRTHFCPLDLADDLPRLDFGAATVRSFNVEELASALDVQRLRRHHPTAIVDLDSLAQFQWLVVEELAPVPDAPSARASPWLAAPINTDWGEVRPHEPVWPQAVEDALFFLLLAPWERWTEMPRTDIYGFRIPWVHTVDSDLFTRPALPPSADTLTFISTIRRDQHGEEYETEEPARICLHKEATTALPLMDESAWASLEKSKAAGLFDTPIQHFILRAFRAAGIDSFLAHITAIEAAVGAQTDYSQSDRTTYQRLGPTKRVATRLAGLLGDGAASSEYARLFDMRCAYIHGRSEIAPISTADRISARRLARRAARALVELEPATSAGQTRSQLLEQLLEKGVQANARQRTQ
ncbi:hypothetical protein CE206_29390 (plasmid) [Achromobacter xylosoxidans]|nr:hypothetical protein CE206_29390 [Achromobacter xylosoxidans]